MELTYEEQAELYKLTEYYDKLEDFMKVNKKLSYVALDYAVVHDLTLFTVDPDLNFDSLEEDINAIIKTIPAIKQIFAKPFIHLKEQNVILPTESVRIINNNTIQHISSHSELWSDVKENEIKPIKLLTRTYEDNYGIYENLFFCKTVDDILGFTRSNLRIIQELIYTNQTIEINLLERVNHLNYFLALGKLHTGYSRNFDSYYGVSIRCLNKLQYIMNTLVPRLKRPVYKNNKTRPKNLKAHKTNILSMHKDYHQIYKLSKYFSLHHIGNEKEFEEVDRVALQKNYIQFCIILSIFSIGHFNFVCDKEKEISFSRFSMNFEFKKWKLKFSSKKLKEYSLLRLDLEKDTKYRILIIPTIEKETEEMLQKIQKQEEADEYIIFSPFEDVKNSIEISMTSIESFRRIQQILLRGMIYADNKREDCPFCNHSLIVNTELSRPNQPTYECTSCRTVIKYGYCSNHKKTYHYTQIANLTKSRIEGDAWLVKRKLEAQMYFRNITDITEDMEILCPYCNQVH
ncbi:MAG: hypothetical protein K2K48_01305 [Anaeroplasmataceae bacterium]|nr:hypothetical protein [Anaeroplasmataceae bacterium]MDE6414027.1 hypothetical protein [Anaeroplasmataceae bacterium]